MKWGAYSTLFLFSTFKFLFTPLGGPLTKLSYVEIWLSCLSGAIFSSALFFYSSEYFMKRAQAKRLKLIKEAKTSGKTLPNKRKFTRSNKFIIRLKKRFGIIGICVLAPLFLSIPIGTIIVAKFYGKDRRAYPILLIGLTLNGLLLTALGFLFFPTK